MKPVKSKSGGGFGEGLVSNSSSGHTTPRDRVNEDISDEDEDDDNDCDNFDEPVTITSPVTESCLASHEFEWLSPTSNAPLPSCESKSKDNDPRDESQEEDTDPPITAAKPPHQSKHSNPFYHRKLRENEHFGCRMTPSPCHDRSCHHHMSPPRSSWCCSSPPPHIPMYYHHSSGSLTGMELVPYNQEFCCSDYPYFSCSCMGPGLQPYRHCDPYSYRMCNHSHFAAPLRDTSVTSSSPHEANRSSSKRPRSAGVRKRDFSPSSVPHHYSSYARETSHPVLSPSPVQAWRDQWKSPIHTEENSSLQKIQQLEVDKKNLTLQVSVLTDQVEAQTEKITELENLLQQKKDQLRAAEQNLHQEMLARSTVESSKLELMTEVSNLRLRLTAAERDRKESDEKCRKIEADLNLLHACIAGKDADLLRTKIGLNGSVLASGDKNSEVEKLRLALESVTCSNEEKDRRIEDLRQSLMKYKKLQDYVLSGHSGKTLDSSIKDVFFCETDFSKSLISSPPSPGGDSNLSKLTKHLQHEGSVISKPPPAPRSNLPSASTSFLSDCAATNWKDSALTQYSPTSSAVNCSLFPNAHPFQKSNSVENVSPSSPKTPSPSSRYGTLPRQSGPQALQHLQEQLQQHEAVSGSTVSSIDFTDGHQKQSFHPSEPILRNEPSSVLPVAESTRASRNKSSGVSFGKGFFKLRSGKRSSSAPELAEQDNVTIPIINKENSSSSATLQRVTQPYVIKSDKEKGKGFMKFFAKWKRSGSQNIEKIEGEFRRGGIRATAGPRLGWSCDVQSDPDIPFCHWNNEMLIDWMHRIGLNMYISELRKWKCNGEQLLKASYQELEKELNIKNPLHKKKLILALESTKSDLSSLPAAINKLDYQWVLRWLDDIGLPQYKDAFLEARVDGRVLHYLTVDDLVCLKVTNQLHHISIKRGIQILREKNFEPHCLIRRSLPDEDKSYTPELVGLWTNHRIMEWLRTVDLSEYAPNLRGSGVHGALIVYEPKFNTDLFATLLNIPPTKTLLRRHLATHFKHVVGNDLFQSKRVVETDQLYTPLTPSLKVKVIRKSQFALKKKKSKSDCETEEFVCPMEIPVSPEALKQGDKLIVRRNSDPVPQEPRNLDLKEEKTADEIGVVSKEISSLTTILHEEKLLRSAPTTNV